MRKLKVRYHRSAKSIISQPDIVVYPAKTVIFVHGCFWHVHRCRYGKVTPATRKKFWQEKRQGNVERDKRNLRNLRKAGWKVLVVWECQTKNLEKLSDKLRIFLAS